MVCITVVSGGEFNCICLMQAKNKVSLSVLWIPTLVQDTEKKRPREGETTSSLQQWREYVLTQPLSGPCQRLLNQKKITHSLKWAFNQA